MGTELQKMLEQIELTRQTIHEAEPSYGPPHEYMNIDRPLTPLKDVFARPPTRVDALRHALYMLDRSEQALKEAHDPAVSADDGIVALTRGAMALGLACGILCAHGIDLKDNLKQAA